MQDGKGYTQALGGNTSAHRLGYLTWITTQLLGKQWHPIPVCRIMLILSKRYTLWNLLAGHLTLMGCTQTKKKAPGRIHGKKKSGLSSDSFLGFHYWPLLETQCWTKQSLSLLQSLSSAPENASHSWVCRFLPLERLMTMFSLPLMTGCILTIPPTMTRKHLHKTFLQKDVINESQQQQISLREQPLPP